MQAGYAEIDITPPVGEEMAGYGFYLNRRATGTLDPLRARALALAVGEERAVVVQLDLIGLNADFVADVRAGVERRTKLPPTHLLLHCTHTHSGPASMFMRGCGEATEEFLSGLRQRLWTVIPQALDALRPVRTARKFEEEFRGLGHNRVGQPEIDTAVRGVWLEPEGEAPIAVVSHACHPVTLGVNREFSADYPGALLRELNAYGVQGLYLNGCSGDINPLSHACRWGGGTAETLRIYGRDLAAVVWRGLEGATEWHAEGGHSEGSHSGLPLRAASRLAQLEGQVPPREELSAVLAEHEARLAEDPVDARSRLEVSWAREMIRRHEAGVIGEPMTAEVQAIAVGDVVFVGLSGEVFTALGQTIRAAFPNHLLLLAATSNGLLGYISTRREIELQGYAASSACQLYNMLTPVPGAGEQYAAQAVEVVAEAMGQLGN
jgi:hypothetical protein